jgi:hypothetical protein
MESPKDNRPAPMKEEKHMGYPGEHPAMPKLRRLVRQFLVHSYLYYELNENVVDDHGYDSICTQLYELMQEFPDMEVPHIELARELDKSGSGYYIEEYPPNIRTTALRLLWHDKKETVKGFNESFPQFLSRWGFYVEGFEPKKK